MDIPDELFMEADEDKLQQIFLNLLSNGINYTLDGGKVKIKVLTIQRENDTEKVMLQSVIQVLEFQRRTCHVSLNAFIGWTKDARATLAERDWDCRSSNTWSICIMAPFRWKVSLDWVPHLQLNYRYCNRKNEL